MKHEYATDSLYFQKAPVSTTRGERVPLSFADVQALHAEICRRARLVLSSRGVKNAARVKLNVTMLTNRMPLELTNDQLAEYACELASDTQQYEYEYL